MLQPEHVEMLGRFVTEKISSAIEPLQQKIADQAREIEGLRADCVHLIKEMGDHFVKEVEAIEVADGKDGKNGIDGRDGRDGRDGASRDEIFSLIKEAIEAIPKPKDGKDGLGFKDMSAIYDGERKLIFRFVLDERIEEMSIDLAHPLYRNVWRPGAYVRGDCVTRDGSIFIATKQTETTPGTKDCDWILAVKRGQNGAQGERGAMGKPGLNGKDGLQKWD